MAKWERVDEPSGGRPRREDEGPARRPRPAAPRYRTTADVAVVPPEVATDIRRSATGATAHHRETLVRTMGEAAAAYERGRFQDALRIGRKLADEVPAVPAVRELLGLAAYRAGRWREACRHLEAYEELTGSVDHVPVVMDSYRALGRTNKVAELWTSLRQRSPSTEVLAEARIVGAGALADRGDVAGAISLLAMAGAGRALRNPAARHVRQWYVLGDLYERVGDVPRARELFTRVLRADPDAYDVADRLESIGPTRPPRRRRTSRGSDARGGSGGAAGSAAAPGGTGAEAPPAASSAPAQAVPGSSASG